MVTKEPFGKQNETSETQVCDHLKYNVFIQQLNVLRYLDIGDL